MNKIQKSKKFLVIVGISVIIISAAAFGLYCIHPLFIYMYNGFYPIDTEELSINCSIHEPVSHFSTFHGLKYMHDLKIIHMFKPDEKELSCIPCNKDISIIISYASVRDPDAIAALRSAGSIHLFMCDADIPGFCSEGLRELSMWSCNITGLDSLGVCSSLEYLEISNCVFDVSDFSENTITQKNEYTTIADSSVFAGLDKIKKLDLTQMDITDISGLLGMDSLEELRISKGCMNEENISALEKAGVKIII